MPKEEWKKSLGEQTTRLILIPLLHTNIMLLLIHIMRLLVFFHKTSVRDHTFFLVILIGLQHIPSRLHMTFIKKQSYDKDINKQITEQTLYHHKHYFLFSLSHPLILQPKHRSFSRHLYLFCCCGITCGCWILDVLGRGFIEGGMGIWGGRGWIGKESCTNHRTRAEPQQIVAQRLLSCLQYPVP